MSHAEGIPPQAPQPKSCKLMNTYDLETLAPNGVPTAEFWALWKTNKDDMRLEGVKLSKKHEKKVTWVLAVKTSDHVLGWKFVGVEKWQPGAFPRTSVLKKDTLRPLTRADIVGEDKPEGAVKEWETKEAAKAFLAERLERYSKFAKPMIREVTEILSSEWHVSMGKPMTHKQLKWAKIKGGNDRSAQAEEMEAWHEEGCKPSRAPLFVNLP